MFTAGAAASSAENRNITKYADLKHSHIFIPMGIETMGVRGLGAAELASALGRHFAIDSGDPRSTFFLGQRIQKLLSKVAMHCPFLEHFHQSWHRRTFRSRADRMALVSSAHPPPTLVIYTPSPAKFVFVFCFVRL